MNNLLKQKYSKELPWQFVYEGEGEGFGAHKFTFWYSTLYDKWGYIVEDKLFKHKKKKNY